MNEILRIVLQKSSKSYLLYGPLGTWSIFMAGALSRLGFRRICDPLAEIVSAKRIIHYKDDVHEGISLTRSFDIVHLLHAHTKNLYGVWTYVLAPLPKWWFFDVPITHSLMVFLTLTPHTGSLPYRPRRLGDHQKR